MLPRENLQASTPDVECGTLVRTPLFYSSILGNARQLIVYLPPGYSADENRRYPVLYMQDGQNLFDGTTSYVPGQHWHLNETADNLIREGAIQPLIMVGVYHAGERRIDEYTPTADPNFKKGGRAARYGRMLAEELKPYIDGAYRTKPDREHTGIGGSSLGGLLSLYLGLGRHGDIFGRVLAMSPSLWWDKCWLLRHLDELTRGQKAKVWIDAGTAEGSNTECNAETLAEALAGRGFTRDAEVKFMRVEGARHSEQDWAHRVHHGLRFTFAADTKEEGNLLPNPNRSHGTAQTQHQLRPVGGVLTSPSTL
ncbi:MAG TPA: alpha/beta hydrolase-fold protein [Pyrinomonadaceae bacterium]|jgi:predicted alpha/beta superfamily hydrolase